MPWDESGAWVVHFSVLPLKLSRSCSASGIKKRERSGREEFTISGTSLKRSNARILHFKHLLLSSMPAAGALQAVPFPKIPSSTCSGTFLTSLIPSEQISPLAGPACSALGLQQAKRGLTQISPSPLPFLTDISQRGKAMSRAVDLFIVSCKPYVPQSCNSCYLQPEQPPGPQPGPRMDFPTFTLAREAAGGKGLALTAPALEGEQEGQGLPCQSSRIPALPWRSGCTWGAPGAKGV